MEKIKVAIFALLLPMGLFAQKTFVDVSDSANIHHVYRPFEGFFGGSAAVLDFNQDGWEDVYITGGVNSDQFLRNNKNGTFTNILEEAGFSLTQDYVTIGIASADVNRDGFPDLLITTNKRKNQEQVIPRAKNLLFINQKNGKFKELSDEFGIGNIETFSTGIAFGDINLDGYPDIYVGNYFKGYQGGLKEISDATIVNAKNTSEGLLYLNIEGKRFENVYEKYGLNHKGYGFGGIMTDFDNDGDLDILVLNDFGYKAPHNFLLENQFPRQEFSYVDEKYGMDLRINAMGAATNDFNGDGSLDYFIPNIRFNQMMVRKNLKDSFIESAELVGMKNYSISWGTNFADFDQDGDEDLFISNGDLNPNCQPFFNYFYENKGGKFEEIAYQIGLKDYGIGRGSVVFDFDNDGDLDILLVNQEAVLNYPTETKTRLFRNDFSKGNYLKIKLKGKNSTEEGLGARIELIDGDFYAQREVDGGNTSHMSHNSRIVHFGVGDKTTIQKIRIIWPGGHRQDLSNIPVNQLIEVVEEDYERPNPSNNLIYWLIGGLILLVFLFFNRKK